MADTRFQCWEETLMPQHGWEMVAPTPGDAARLYVSTDYEGDGNETRVVFVRPLDGGQDLRFIVQVETETTFTARLAEWVAP